MRYPKFAYKHRTEVGSWRLQPISAAVECRGNLGGSMGRRNAQTMLANQGAGVAPADTAPGQTQAITGQPFGKGRMSAAGLGAGVAPPPPAVPDPVAASPRREAPIDPVMSAAVQRGESAPHAVVQPQPAADLVAAPQTPSAPQPMSLVAQPGLRARVPRMGGGLFPGRGNRRWPPVQTAAPQRAIMQAGKIGGGL